MKKLEAAKIFHRSPDAKKAGAFLLLPAISIALVCVMLLVDTSWAWFVCTTQGAQTIRVANYYVTIAVTEVASAEALLADALPGKKLEEAEGGGYQLTGNTTYQIVLEAFGSVSRGYCTVSCGESVYTTDEMVPGQTLVFIITPPEDAHFGVIAVWGYGPEQPDIINGSVLGEKKLEPLEEEQTEPAQEGDQDSTEGTMQEPEAPEEAPGETTAPPEKPGPTTAVPEATEPVPEATQPEDSPEEPTPEATQPGDSPEEPIPEATQPEDSPEEPIPVATQPEEPAPEAPQPEDQLVEQVPEELLLPKERFAELPVQLETLDELAVPPAQTVEPMVLAESVEQAQEPIELSHRAVEPRLKTIKIKESEEVEETPAEALAQ